MRTLSPARPRRCRSQDSSNMIWSQIAHGGARAVNAAFTVRVIAGVGDVVMCGLVLAACRAGPSARRPAPASAQVMAAASSPRRSRRVIGGVPVGQRALHHARGLPASTAHRQRQRPAPTASGNRVRQVAAHHKPTPTAPIVLFTASASCRAFAYWLPPRVGGAFSCASSAYRRVIAKQADRLCLHFPFFGSGMSYTMPSSMILPKL